MLEVNVQGLLYITLHAALPHLLRAARTPRGGGGSPRHEFNRGPGRPAGEDGDEDLENRRQRIHRSPATGGHAEGVRVSVVEPGTVDTELSTHFRDGVRQAIERQIEGMELLAPEDIADAVTYIVTRDRRVAVNDILVRLGENSVRTPADELLEGAPSSNTTAHPAPRRGSGAGTGRVDADRPAATQLQPLTSTANAGTFRLPMVYRK